MEVSSTFSISNIQQVVETKRMSLQMEQTTEIMIN